MIAIVILLVLGAAALTIGPRLAALCVLALVGIGIRRISASQEASFRERSNRPADAWEQSSSDDQRLLARSLKMAMARISLSSQYPAHAF